MAEEDNNAGAGYRGTIESLVEVEHPKLVKNTPLCPRQVIQRCYMRSHIGERSEVLLEQKKT
jgi:hypothetical protein